jgi:hypothetical protein
MMKKLIMIACVALMAVAPNGLFADEKLPKPKEAAPVEGCKTDVAQHLQDISVTIVSKGQGGGEGSGVIKTRVMADGTKVNFVWTAAHVVDNLRTTRTVIDGKSGSTKVVVEFADALVVKSLVEDGRLVGKTEFLAEVIRYSSEEDLALLRIRKSNFIDCSAKFYLEVKDGKPVIPAIGTKLLHVGSLLGQMGSNSMTEGIMSQHGRLINKVIFDQTTVAAFPGSSGGGVYLADGRLVGLVLRGAGETFNLIAPVRRLQEWSKKASVEWAVDNSVKMPTEDELRKLPVEDNGVTFSYSARAEAIPAPKPESAHLEVVMFGKGRHYLGSEKLELQFPTLKLIRKISEE